MGEKCILVINLFSGWCTLEKSLKRDISEYLRLEILEGMILMRA